MLEKILFVATPYSSTCIGYSLMLARWTGATLYILSSEKDVALSQAVLMRAEEFNVRAFPNIIPKLSDTSINQQVTEIKPDLVAMGIRTAQTIWKSLPNWEIPVYILNRALPAHHNITSVVVAEDTGLAQKNTQLHLSLLLAGSLGGAVRLAHLLENPSLMMGDSRLSKQGLVKMTTDHLEQVLNSLDAMIEEFSADGIEIEQNVLMPAFLPKIENLIKKNRVHCLVISQKVQKLLRLNWRDFEKSLPCSLLIVRNAQAS